jgi:hypothetical protein
MSAMATRESMLAEEARQEFRSAKGWLHSLRLRSLRDFSAEETAFDAMFKAWLRWEHRARTAGLDPLDEVFEWRHSQTPATTIQRIPAEERLTFADLHADNWRSVEHEAVPDSTRNALLAILGWGADHPGGVFVRRREDAGPLFGLVTWVADGRGDVRQDIALQVPICEHDVPLAEGCSVCGGAMAETPR